MTEKDAEVLIVGGGPTGMMLAGEPALAGVHVTVVERRANREFAGSRAGGLHSRTIEVFDQRGIADQFLSAGQVAQVAGFGGTRLDISDCSSRHPYGLGLWQQHIERILSDWIGELAVPVLHGCEVVGFRQTDTGVEVSLGDGPLLRAAYLVGCDGGRSLVRKAAGIAFPGTEAAISSLIAEVEMKQEPPLDVHRSSLGVHSFGRTEYEIRDGRVVFADHGPIRVMVTEAQVADARDPTLNDLRVALIAAFGTDYGIYSATSISRFTDASRQAASYRRGRVLLAGDAAHVHYPVGGQGLNVGVQDAVNLGWKLAQVVKGVSPEGLLDSYHTERHPTAARVLNDTMAQVALLRGDERTNALRDTVTELLSMHVPRKRFGAVMSGLDICYDFGEGHPLLGRRMPDLDLVTADGPTRVSALLHKAQPVQIDLGLPGRLDISPWADRVRRIRAEQTDPWELPVIGEVTAPKAVLIRPDGHVAWVGLSNQEGLASALTTWFGPAAG